MGLWDKIARMVRRARDNNPRTDFDEFRRCRFETMEGRRLLNADPIRMGAVYIEEDIGSDAHGDTFEITFLGGAAQTQLTRVVISGDQGEPGFGRGDVFFDTAPTGLGADHAFPFQIVSLQTKNPNATVSATVQDGTSTLILDFTNFEAGDKLIFSIDVDEVEDYDPNETNPDLVNDGMDPITSGVEFQNSKITAFFKAPHFHDSTGNTEFRNRYDDLLVGTGLNLPADDAGGKRDRSDGAVLHVTQTPLPIAISGTVYVETNLDLVQNAGEPGLGNVELSLWQKQGDSYVFTGRTTKTDANGNYEFGTQLGLLPGTYQIRETQPSGYYSVGAVPGTVEGKTSGTTVAGNRDVLTEITIPLGDQRSVDNDFAEALPAKISGYVFHDRSNDGQRNSGEEGIAGVTVRVIPVDTIAPQDAVTVQTNANGFYEVTNLVPGSYRVIEVSQPPSFFDGLDSVGTVAGITVGTAVNPGDNLENIFLGGGQAGIEYNFGEIAPASLRGRVHLSDKDGNCFVPGVPARPIEGVLIKLLNAQGQEIAQARTNSHGEYEFTGLRPGVYSVVEVTPAGLIDGEEHVGNVAGTKRGQVDGNDKISGITLGSGQAGEEYNFCEHEASSLSGLVYHDANDNGIRDSGEEPIGEVEVELRDSTGKVVAKTKTTSTGTYEFRQLSAGTYTVVEVQPSGWLDGRDTVGTVSGKTVGSASNDRLQGVTLGWGEAGINYNFGELLSGSISGQVHADKDGDCELDPGEETLAGVTIELLNSDGQTIATTLTDSEGRYKFDDLAPGVYGIREIQPTGYFHGGQSAGSNGGSDMLDDLITNIRVGSGQDLTNYDFCEVPPSSLAGIVFSDPNGDCVFNEGDSPLANVKVELLNSRNEVVAVTQTNAEGRYKFENLAPGTYSVREHQPAGHFHGGQSAGSGGGNDQTPDLISQINVTPGVDLIDYNFCEVPPSTLAGRVFSDPNGDCMFNAGDEALANVTIQLLDSNQQIIATTQTDSDGFYKFENLGPGTYSVRELQPDRYFDGGHMAGTGGGNVDTPNLISQIMIHGGVHLVDYDFCEVPPAALSGYVFQDGPPIVTPNGQVPQNLGELRDGQRTPDDKPLPGVLLQLRDGFTGEPIDGSEALSGRYGPGPIQVRTDENGYYEFRDIPGGRSYAVYQVHPNGYVDGIDTVGTTTGFAFNSQILQEAVIIEPLAGQPLDDAIIRIAVAPGEMSENNNFSEVQIETQVIPPPPDPPVYPPLDPPVVPRVTPPPITLPAMTNPAPTYLAWSAPRLNLYHEISGSSIGYTWHLSVMNGGMPRDIATARLAGDDTPQDGTFFAKAKWNADQFQDARWLIGVHPAGQARTEASAPIFGIHGARPLAGDFNGDGKSEIALFYRGEWFIDLNGNGQWDEEDLWAKLGDELDRPVVGDWDGDGKDDIGIYGPEWFGDQRQINREPGLPDSFNDPHQFVHNNPKNVPPPEAEATDGRRLIQLKAEGLYRADVIDHVFRYGAERDIPVAGDWNGDGIRTVGIFRDGEWRVDMDGNGVAEHKDRIFKFGKKGDFPVVGDWDGNGVEEIGVYRKGKWILDTNGNHELDAHDRVFEMGGAADIPVVGDWNGDGIDEPGLYRELPKKVPGAGVDA